MQSRTRVVAIVTLSMLGITGVTWGHDPTPPTRSITVTGTAELKVVPDEVVFSMGVESFAKEIAPAKADNDERVRKVLATATQLGVQPEDVQTGDLWISPRYESPGGMKTVLTGYEVRKGISLTLRDVSKFEALLAALIEGGLNRVHGIEFRSSELVRHREQARTDALRAAREKATKMAEVLDERVGRPITIVEEPSGPIFPMQRMAANSVAFAPGDASGGETVALGKITIRASVTVTFALD